MAQSAEMTTRNWSVMVIGAILLAGGLLMLALPVSLAEYDRFGIQISCGNGYQSQLLQASLNDERSAGQPGPGGSPAAAEPASDHVAQCKDAVAHRRLWSIPIGIIGTLMLLPQLMRWARSRATTSPLSAAREAWLADEHPDEQMHEAALLDRRERSHRH